MVLLVPWAGPVPEGALKCCAGVGKGAPHRESRHDSMRRPTATSPTHMRPWARPHCRPLPPARSPHMPPHMSPPPLPPAGVWPEFALINHSCVPNTVPVLVADRLLVRAVAQIPEGGEVTTSYLGPLVGACVHVLLLGAPLVGPLLGCVR